MVKLKALDWQIRDDDVVHADPIGLLKSYYIFNLPQRGEAKPVPAPYLIFSPEEGAADVKKHGLKRLVNGAVKKF